MDTAGISSVRGREPPVRHRNECPAPDPYLLPQAGEWRSMSVPVSHGDRTPAEEGKEDNVCIATGQRGDCRLCTHRLGLQLPYQTGSW